MTYKEIIDTIAGYNRRMEMELKLRASIAYRTADLIGTGIACLIKEGVEFPTIKEAFPGLFDDIEIETKPQQQDWRVMKDRLMKYAESHNSKVGETKNDH